MNNKFGIIKNIIKTDRKHFETLNALIRQNSFNKTIQALFEIYY